MLKAFSALLIAIVAFLSNTVYAHQAEVQNISSDKYFETTLAEIDSAKLSVVVYMYLVSIDKNQNQTQPYQLLNALIRAKERGVNVEAVFDQNVDYMEGVPIEEGSSRAKNIAAYEILKKHDIPVYFDEPDIYTHSKVVVIDNETVILGSTNWTNTGLARNIESNLLVRSKELAAEVLADLSKVKRQDPKFNASKMVSVSWEFTNQANLMGDMVSNSDERAFDIYLYLLREYDGNPEAKISLRFDDLAKPLGMENMSSADYRRQIIKVLKKLQDRYKLIEYKPEYGKDALILLKDYSDPSKPYAYPQSKFLKIPEAYWTNGWSKSLSFAAKVMYLLNLSYSPIAQNPPKWHTSLNTLAERHHVSEWFLSQGTTELRRMNLVEVEYSPIPKEGETTRKPTLYTPNYLYNQEKQQDLLTSLETQYGKDKLDRAKAHAVLVYEDHDTNALKTLIELENQYGSDIVTEASKIVADKNPDNPKRTIAYLIAIIRGMNNSKEQAINDRS